MLVTKKAPNFTAKAVLADNQIVADFELYKNLGKNGAVLFFWPLDFTFVCPSEIIAFSNRVNAFKERGMNIIGVSIDSEFTHFAWKNTPVEEGGVGDIQFPMVADIDKSITRSYDILLNESVALHWFIFD